jgi:hypothetical protein
VNPDVRTGTWEAYARALTELHEARVAAAAGRQGRARRRAEHEARLHALDAALAAQQAELRELSAELRAPLPPGALGPLPVPPLDGAAAHADAQARLDSAGAAVVEARRVARLPQLLPEWSGDLGRAALVYLLLALPNVVLAVALSVAGVHGNDPALLWFAVIWPLATLIGGAVALGRAAAPRLPPDEPVAGPARIRRPRRYPWLGVLVAWASWLVPSWLLDQLAALTGG